MGKLTTKHGHSRRGSRSAEYEAWVGIRKRVNNPNCKEYPYYGGRGITYDPRWEDFELFLSDVGLKPSEDCSIDRVDNSKGYFPDNVRWASKKQQSNNRRNNILVEGVTLKEWATEKGFNYKTVWRWYKEGKSVSYMKQRGETLWVKDRTT